MRPVEPGPPKRIVPPDGMRALDGGRAPPGAPRSAGEQAPALRSGAERGPMPRRPRHHPVPRPSRRDLPGGAAPATPEDPTPPSSKRSPRFRLGTAVGWLSMCRPPAGRSPRMSSRAALRFCQSRSPASTSCNHLSLAGPRRPRVRDGEAPWVASGWRPKPLTDRLDLEATPDRDGRVRPSREWFDPSHEHPSSRSVDSPRRRPRWLACEAPRAPAPPPE